MSEKKRFKLSEELQSIFKESAEYVKKVDYKEVSVDIVMYTLLKRYFKDNKGTDPILNEYFSNLSEADKLKIFETSEIIAEDIINEYNNPLPKSLKHDDLPVVTSFIVDDILKRAKIEQAMFMTAGDVKEDEITIETSIFFLSVLFDVGELIEYFSGFGIDKESLTKLIISKGPNKIEKEQNLDPIGDLKEKIINNSSAVSSQNDDDKERIDSEDKEFEMAGKMGSGENMIQDDPNSEHPFLDKYCINMNKEVDNYDPLIGREKELNQIVEVLNCRKKRNVILVADEGVGKDCLIEGFVTSIVKGNVPKKLKDKVIYSFDLNKVTSNSTYRGQLEAKLDGILSEASKDKNVILYIPEIHSLDGANSNNSSGAGGVEDVLKPYLTGKISVIGSTTTKEIRVVEKDPAFKRRFQIVKLDEPNIEETIEILKGLRSNYSKFHHVKFSDEVIKLCVNLSDRYITDKHQPDKSVDCIDMIGSLVNLRETDKGDGSELTRLEKDLAEVINDKIKLVKDQDFEAAAKIRDKEKELKKKIESIRKTKEKEEENSKNWPEATKEDVLNVISKISKVPVDKINLSDAEKIRQMKYQMEKNVIGQQEAIDGLTLALQRNILGLRDENKPIASIFLSGVTSSGKTLCVKMLAKYFFGSEKNLIRFDMGEFTQDHEVTKLISTSAGFVGYNDKPLLDEIRQKPYSVVLFDEIEKAAKSINNIFLNILSEGYITLGNGTRVDFRNTIVVYTSNVGTSEILMRGDGLGFSKLNHDEKNKDSKDIVLKAMKKCFKPEFISRLTDIIVFNNLTKENFEKIFDLELNKVSERLKKKGLKLTTSKAIKDLVVSESKNGRDLEKGIIKYVENEICKSMVNDSIDVNTISGISVDYKDGKVIINYKPKLKRSSSKKSAEVKKIEIVEEERETIVE